MLTEVIYWYLAANKSSNGIDAGIILTQTALERISFEYCVKKKMLISVDGYKKITASDKLRLLFSSLNIPLDIHLTSNEITNMTKEKKWTNTPYAITEVRNSLVHPEHKSSGKFDKMMFETWNLGLWYMEMSILAICGYNGTYGNRLKRRFIGTCENVPWKK